MNFIREVINEINYRNKNKLTTEIAPVINIPVRQLGLRTGQVIIVRRDK